MIMMMISVGLTANSLHYHSCVVDALQSPAIPGINQSDTSRGCQIHVSKQIIPTPKKSSL